MLQLSTLEFLKNLKKNNNKPWFEGHRKLYDAAKADRNQSAAGIPAMPALLQSGNHGAPPSASSGACAAACSRTTSCRRDRSTFSAALRWLQMLRS